MEDDSFMEEILTLDRQKERTLLFTSLSEEEYAKTKFSRHMEGEGFIAREESDGKITFLPWKFRGAVSTEEGVFFEGPYFDGQSISSILMNYSREEENSKEEPKKEKIPDNHDSSKKGLDTRALFFLIKSFTAAINENVSLPCNGIFGILYSEKNGKEALFLPEKAFNRSVMNLGKEKYAVIQEPYRDTNLNGKEALIFERAILSYFSLTKVLPYPPKKGDKSVDISYRNFIPLEYKINGIDKKLSASVNASLSQDFSASLKKDDFSLDTFEKELFCPEERKAEFSKEDFQKNTEIFIKKQQKRVREHRKFNRIKGSIVVSLVVAAFIAIFTATIIHENSKKPVSTGLTSKETTELFYKGIHTMNTEYMLAAAKPCPEAQSYISRLPQIYVTANMRAAFNFESGISTPENWMFFEPESSRAYSHFIFGITNFTIDGESSILNLKVPSRKEHKAPVLKENGERLNEFSKSQHKVHYFLVHNVDNYIKVEEYTTLVHLKWQKKGWQISLLDEVSCSDFYLPQQISLDYKNIFDKVDGDYIKASLQLKEKYPWLPTEASLKEEKERLDAVGYF